MYRLAGCLSLLLLLSCVSSAKQQAPFNLQSFLYGNWTVHETSVGWKSGTEELSEIPNEHFGFIFDHTNQTKFQRGDNTITIESICQNSLQCTIILSIEEFVKPDQVEETIFEEEENKKEIKIELLLSRNLVSIGKYVARGVFPGGHYEFIIAGLASFHFYIYSIKNDNEIIVSQFHSVKTSIKTPAGEESFWSRAQLPILFAVCFIGFRLVKAFFLDGPRRRVVRAKEANTVQVPEKKSN